MGGETRFRTCHIIKKHDNLLILLSDNMDKNCNIWITNLMMMMFMIVVVVVVVVVVVIIIIIIIINAYTQFTSWFLFTYLFLILHGLSPDSTTTNLHIFLSLSHSFLLVAAWWPWYSCRCFLPLWESQNFLSHSQKCRYFHDSAEPGTFGNPNQIFWNAWDRSP